MDEQTKIEPDWCLIKMDERHHWRDDIQEKTKAIWAVYAFDRNSRTFCCELTPSYELHFIACDEEPIDDISDDDRDELSEDIMRGTHDYFDQAVTYMHVSVVERFIKEKPDRLRQVTLDDDEITGGEEADWIGEHWNTGALMY
jgi:hypothetical protein